MRLVLMLLQGTPVIGGNILAAAQVVTILLVIGVIAYLGRLMIQAGSGSTTSSPGERSSLDYGSRAQANLCRTAQNGSSHPDDRCYTVAKAARYFRQTNETITDEAVCQLVEKGLIKREKDRPELLTAGSVHRWKDVEEARRYIGEDDKKKEAARLDYEQTLTTYRMLADIRFKLLAFIPVVSGIAITLLSTYVMTLEPQITLVIGALGFMVTLGIVIYDQRNSQIHDVTVGRARFLEDVLKFPARKGRSGHMSQRPDDNRRLFYLIDMWHDRGLALIYGAVLGAWMFPIAYGVLDLWEDFSDTGLYWSKYSAAGLLAALTAAVFFVEFQRLEGR